MANVGNVSHTMFNILLLRDDEITVRSWLVPITVSVYGYIPEIFYSLSYNTYKESVIIVERSMM